MRALSLLKIKHLLFPCGLCWYLFMCCAGAAAESAPSTLTATSVSENIVLIQGAGANVVVAQSPQGLVIVDGGSAAYADQVMDAIVAHFGARPIIALFNTHWHAEQTGLNTHLGKRGVPIIAHENTKQWLGVEVTVKWSGQTYPALADYARPKQTFYKTGELAFGEQTIEYGYLLQAHTDGDIYIFFPKDNVLVAGGVIASDRWPIIDWWTGGWYSGMIDGLLTLLDIADANTTIVPAHGQPVSRAWLQQEYEMHEALFKRIFGLLQKSQSPAETVAAKPAADLHPEWDNLVQGSTDQFVENAFRSLYGHLRGEKRMGSMP